MDYISEFTVIFLSILLEALPFILIGSIVSAVIEVFISPDLISRFLLKNKIAGIFISGLLGIIFPVCECAIVPIVRRLVKKGVPFSSAVTFMLSVPILNPVVLSSTYIAFYPMKKMFILRGLMGYFIAVISGLIWHFVFKDRVEIKEGGSSHTCSCHTSDNSHGHTCSCHTSDNSHGHTCSCHTSIKEQNKSYYEKYKKFFSIIDHTIEEFFEIGKYLIIGSLVAAVLQTFLPGDILLKTGFGSVLSIFVMMFLAYILSICSEADAFIARGFFNYVRHSSVLAFLVYGPMMDIKLTFMLLGSFDKKSVFKLIILVTVLNFLMALIVNVLF